MACKLCEEKLLEYLYGELHEEDRGAMEEHLKESPACMETFKSFQSIREMAADQGEEEIPSGLRTRILAHAEEKQEKSRRRFLWARFIRPAATLAMVLIVAALVYMNTSRMQGPENEMHSMIRPEEAAPAPEETLVARSFMSSDELTREKTLGSTELSRALSEKKAGKIHGITGKDRGEARLSSPAKQPPEAFSNETSQSKVVALLRREPKETDADLSGDEGAADAELQAIAGGAGRKADGKAKGLGAPGATAPAAPGARLRVLADSPVGEREPTPDIAPPSFKEELAESKSGEPDALIRAMELAKAGRCDESLSALKTCAESYPKESEDSPIWLELSRCFLEKGRKDPALEMARKASKVPATAGEAEALIQWIREIPEVD